jgi:hypothetical protein
MPSPTPAFECANRCLGRGEASGGLWFVGLEDADDCGPEDTQPDVIEYYAKQGNPEVLPCDDRDWSKLRSGLAIRAYTCKIANTLSREPMDTWKAYLQQRLWKTGCQLFQANLYPLGKPRRADWGSNFGEVYGFSAEHRDDYERYVRQTRFPEIARLWRRSKPQAVVCFGKEAWCDFRQVFDVQSPADVIAEGAIRVHTAEKVILSPFFARWHMSNARAQQIANRLVEWRVSIP